MSKEAITLQLEKRETLGKAVRQLRRDGQVPAVIHDHGKPSVHVQADYAAIFKVWQQAGKHHPVQLSADGKKFTALIKTADFSPRKHQLTHVVFNAVGAKQKVEAEVPVHAKYAEGNESSPAERAGLIVLSQLETVAVESTPDKIPDVIYYDAEKLVAVGDHVSVADLIVSDGVEIKTEASHAVASVFEPSALAAANDAAGGEAEAGEEPELTGEAEAEAEAAKPEEPAAE